MVSIGLDWESFPVPLRWAPVVQSLLALPPGFLKSLKYLGGVWALAPVVWLCPESGSEGAPWTCGH